MSSKRNYIGFDPQRAQRVDINSILPKSSSQEKSMKKIDPVFASLMPKPDKIIVNAFDYIDLHRYHHGYQVYCDSNPVLVTAKAVSNNKIFNDEGKIRLPKKPTHVRGYQFCLGFRKINDEYENKIVFHDTQSIHYLFIKVEDKNEILIKCLDLYTYFCDLTSDHPLELKVVRIKNYLQNNPNISNLISLTKKQS